MKKQKVLFISSSQLFFDVFIKDFCNGLSNKFEMYLITNLLKKKSFKSNINYLHLPISRKIAIFTDLYCLFLIIYKVFFIKPDFIVTMTPKSIIFGSFLKLLLPSITRIHIYTGITWTNMKGLNRLFFIYLDKINIYFSNKLIFDSNEQIIFLNNNNFSTNKFYLIANGSIKGVNPDKFCKLPIKKRVLLRSKYNIPPNKTVILYLGRLDFDKGLCILLKSFNLLYKENTNLYLVLVGNDEMDIKTILNKLNKENRTNILLLKHTKNPEKIMNVADIFCLPSLREGFGNVVIEASACELPVVGSNIYGLKSSIKNNLNGITFKVGDINDLTKKLLILINNTKLRNRIGRDGRKFVIQNFNTNLVYKSLEKLLFN